MRAELDPALLAQARGPTRVILKPTAVANGATAGIQWSLTQRPGLKNCRFAQKFQSMSQFCVTMHEALGGHHVLHRERCPGRRGRQDGCDDALRPASVFQIPGLIARAG